MEEEEEGEEGRGRAAATAAAAAAAALKGSKLLTLNRPLLEEEVDEWEEGTALATEADPEATLAGLEDKRKARREVAQRAKVERERERRAREAEEEEARQAARRGAASGGGGVALQGDDDFDQE